MHLHTLSAMPDLSHPMRCGHRGSVWLEVHDATLPGRTKRVPMTVMEQLNDQETETALIYDTQQLPKAASNDINIDRPAHRSRLYY